MPKWTRDDSLNGTEVKLPKLELDDGAEALADGQLSEAVKASLKPTSPDSTDALKSLVAFSSNVGQARAAVPPLPVTITDKEGQEEVTATDVHAIAREYSATQKHTNCRV